jgi:ubiquinone/menaquinone biosynthesis C-methylase UbiE
LEDSGSVSAFDPIQYKINTKINWDTVAPLYHKNWASTYTGPFKATIELIKFADINPNDTVLDLACGTGAVSKEAARHINNKLDNCRNNKGILIGVDISRSALSLAKLSTFPYLVRSLFIEMDAENLGFRKSFFSKILCQFGLMFFPNTLSVLKEIKELLRKDGKLCISVHGTSERVPYFSCIMDPILKQIPNLRPKGAPSVHALGNQKDLCTILQSANFSNILIRKYNFYYLAGTFEEYWSDYMSSTANSILPILKSKGTDTISSIKRESKENSEKYTDNKGTINFPWEVLIATAFNNKKN